MKIYCRYVAGLLAGLLLGGLVQLAPAAAPAAVATPKVTSATLALNAKLQQVARESGTIHTGESADKVPFAYWAAPPPGHKGKSPLPTIVFFHCRGWGQTAWKNNLLEPDAADFRVEAWKRGYLLIAIAYGENSWMAEPGRRMALAALTDARKHYAIDAARTYGMGMSMGGCGSMIFAKYNPGLFAAVCDLAGVSQYADFYNMGKYQKKLPEALGGTPQTAPEAYKALSVLTYPEAFRDTPVLMIHGDADKTVSIDFSRRLHQALDAAGVKNQLIEMPGHSHAMTILHGNEQTVLNFFEQARKPKP
jgi:dipeptidyl aminopeptidase/acylaminoacyl peptidase